MTVRIAASSAIIHASSSWTGTAMKQLEGSLIFALMLRVTFFLISAGSFPSESWHMMNRVAPSSAKSLMWLQAFRQSSPHPLKPFLRIDALGVSFIRRMRTTRASASERSSARTANILMAHQKVRGTPKAPPRHSGTA